MFPHRSHEARDDRGPVTWFRGYPIYASGVLVVAHVATMVLTALLMATGLGGWVQVCAYQSGSVTGGLAVWQLATYAFVHPPPYLWFVIEMVLLWMFGKDIEKEIGRRDFLQMYAALLLPTLLLTAAAIAGVPSNYVGSGALHFAVFIAYATLFPRAEMFFGFQARWVAAVLFGINVLQALALGDMVSALLTVVSCGAALGLMEIWRRTGSLWSWGGLLPRRPHLRVVPPAAPAAKNPPAKAPAQKPAHTQDDVDRVLEKISQKGIKSLTKDEKKILDAARSDLLSREKR